MKRFDTTALGRPTEYFTERGAENTVREILHQPRLWNELCDYLSANRNRIAKFMEDVLAIPNLRIVFTGAGSSAFIGESLQRLLAEETGVRSETVHTTDIVSAPDSVLFDTPTLLVSYSRSGESPESVGAIKHAEKKVSSLYNIVICCKKNSSLAEYSERSARTLVLDMPPESSDAGFAMTSSVSCMALATWCIFGWRSLDEKLAYVRELAKSVEAEFPAIYEAAGKLAANKYERVVYLGSGGLAGLARESAVKSLELTNGLINAGYDTAAGFRHGPKTVVHPNTLTVHYISSNALTAKYDIDLLTEMIGEKRENLIAAVMPENMGNLPEGVDYAFSYKMPEPSFGYGICSYIKGLMFAQLLSVEKSLDCGMKTDNPCAGGEVNRVVQGVVIHNL